MRNLNALLVFVKVAETRSFTLAAQRLGLTSSAISKSIARLEQELGVKLLQRSTRLVSLTGEGASFFERCRQIMTEIEAAESAITATADTPKGRLRIQMPVGFGRSVIVPKMWAFTRLYPELSVDIELSDRLVDLTYEAVDAVIQIGPVSDDRLVSHRLCNLSFAAYASPEYLSLHGIPQSPDELDHHQCLAYLLPTSGEHRLWQFVKDGKDFSKTVSGALNINNAESLLEAAIGGAGIVMVSDFIAGDALRSGKLQRILSDYVVAGPEVSLLHLPRSTLAAKVRVFIDFLQAVIQDIDPQALSKSNQ
jgi:LysR family transcriptional regulator, regulator for bpeEF and oprC